MRTCCFYPKNGARYHGNGSTDSMPRSMSSGSDHHRLENQIDHRLENQMDHRLENQMDHRLENQMDHRLESEKDHLTLQVSVLMDQIDAQAEKIRDLEKALSDRRAAMTVMCNGDAAQNVSNCDNRVVVGHAWIVSGCNAV